MCDLVWQVDALSVDIEQLSTENAALLEVRPAGLPRDVIPAS